MNLRELEAYLSSLPDKLMGDAAEIAVEIGVVFCLGENTVCNDVGDSLWAEIIYH